MGGTTPNPRPPPTQINDFTVLALRFPSLPSFARESLHYIYLRANAPKVPTEETPRELFLVNIPIDATATHIRSLFALQLGGARVEEVVFEDSRAGKGIHKPVIYATDGKKSKKRKRGSDGEVGDGGEVGLLPEIWDRELHHTGSTAVVRFVDRPSAELALKAARRSAKAAVPLSWGASSVQHSLPPLGSARYAAHHKLRYPDPSALQSSVDSFMAAFAAQESERARLFARLRSEPDTDGFVTVTRGGRKGPAREEETREKEEELKRREKGRVRDDFYRFQVRERKKESARDLVRGFEEDRRRVEEMRKRRGRVRPE